MNNETFDKAQFIKDVQDNVKNLYRKTIKEATQQEIFQAVSFTVKDVIIDEWLATQRSFDKQDPKMVYYMSMEFLMGRALGNNLINLKAYKQVKEALEEMGLNLDVIEDQEPDPALGNGGLGRLAACFMESLATLGYAAYGCGIRYRYGMFKQKIKDGFQVEVPDNWLKDGYPFELRRPEHACEVKFGGYVRAEAGENGRTRFIQEGYQSVNAVPYDMPIIGYGNNVVNTLMIWDAEPMNCFELDSFDKGDYHKAVEQENLAKNLVEVLYPNDNHIAGKELRLKQQYFFVSASVQRAVARFKKNHPDIHQLPEKVTFQLNDTHPTVAVAELMRVLLDEEGLEWDEAWEITTKTCAYTNHTIMEAQLVETAILNILNHQCLIATKSARVCYAAKGDGVMEFGLRRAQGPDAGTYGARAAVIGGCTGTSNVLAGQLFDVPVKGTHAHSWIMSFPDEYTAFKKYAELYPSACILLVDTYDTLKSGMPNAIRVFKEMREAGIPLTFYGIRMDSGDLAYLSKKVRKMLDEAGFPDAVISASNDLDEYLIESLKLQGAVITSWGVGTNLITAKDNPAFGGVYKLAAIRDENGTFIPKIKLSENTEKVTNPGNKTIYRIYDKNTGKIRADLICLVGEVFDPEEDMTIFDPNEPWKKTRLAGGSYTLRELLVPVFKDGKCIYESPSVMEIQEICNKEKDTIWDETKRFVNPHEIHVDLSKKLYDLKNDLLNELHNLQED